jgi:FAD:protein FMN transferase
MPEPAKTSRRDFLKGRSAARALGDVVIGPPEPLPPPASAELPRTWLLNISREAMACEFEVLQSAGQYPAGPDAAIAALDLVERLEAQLTVYRDTSELAAINCRAAAGPVAVEPLLFDLLVRAVALYEATRGAFDVTAGPLSRVWGFYRRQGRMPDGAEIAATLACVGSDKLELDPAGRTVRFRQPGMELNLGAIGKGYAIDRAAALLESAGIHDFCLHGGNSSVLARGMRNAERGMRNTESEHSALETGWSIALRHPLMPDVRLAEFRLVNQALGTSGSGTQFFHYEGRRYGHILDPRTGWPADQVLSCTVIAPTAEQADALSTALYVLGLDAARQFCAAHPNIAALLVTTTPQAGGIDLCPLNLPKGAWRRLAD